MVGHLQKFVLENKKIAGALSRNIDESPKEFV
jgi:hypothetical protein